MSFIGVIDSGVGGLTILKSLRRRYKYNFCYIADHAFCPYGIKSNQEVFARVDKLTTFLKAEGAQAVVIACNTASVYAKQLSKLHNVPVFDVIVPTCQQIIGNCKKVALLATDATIRNGMYKTVLSEYGIEVVNFPCSSFVPYVEQCKTDSSKCLQTIKETLSTLPEENADAVILGCTHFPLLKRQIAPYCGTAQIVECVCNLPSDILQQEQLPNIIYLTTGNVKFANKAAKPFDNVCFNKLSI